MKPSAHHVKDHPIPLLGFPPTVPPRAKTVTEYGRLSLSYFVRPLSLGLAGLVLALILWGLAYRLSLYHPHQNHHARVTVAKLWIGPRETFFALNKQTRSTVQHSPYTQSVPVTGVSLPVFNRAFAITTSAPPSQRQLDSPLGSPRSPPQAL